MSIFSTVHEQCPVLSLQSNNEEESVQTPRRSRNSGTKNTRVNHLGSDAIKLKFYGLNQRPLDVALWIKRNSKVMVTDRKFSAGFILYIQYKSKPIYSKLEDKT